MTRFTDRVERDLSQISDRATPSSSTAWEAIQHRIDEQDTTAPTMEVIMLDPDTNKLDKRPRRGMLVAASVAAIALLGGLVVVANRDDDIAPADRPDPTVPVTDPAIGGDPEPAPVAVDPELPTDPDGVSGAESGGEVLPPVGLPTQGILSATCTTSSFDENDDGTITGPQTCVLEADPLPVAALEQNSLTIYLSGPDTPDLFVSAGNKGSFTAGYTTPDGLPSPGSVRYSGLQPGVDDYSGETIYFLGARPGGSEADPGTSDWTTAPGDTPLPTTAQGARFDDARRHFGTGISADVSVTCTTELVSGDNTEQVLDQTCTYASDDTRFVTAPDLVRVRVFPANPDSLTLGNGPTFFTAQADSGAATAGVSEDGTKIRAVGFRAGTGEFEGLLIHDVMYLIADSDANITGVIRSTVYPDA